MHTTLSKVPRRIYVVVYMFASNEYYEQWKYHDDSRVIYLFENIQNDPSSTLD